MMLIGRKGKVRNIQFDKVTCPAEFKDLPQEFSGVIVAGPDPVESETSFEYSLLVCLEDGRLFSTSYRNFTLDEPIQPAPF